ncbi:MAG: hypothetical protein RL213_809 [Bacteroidota bacterium]|jgi:hypothetical protein
MKRLIFTLPILLFGVLHVQAQRRAEIAVSGGVTNYVGDLANEALFPYSSARTGAAITFRNFAGNPRIRYKTVDPYVRLSWHRLQYDESSPLGGKQGIDLRNYRRGLGFRNDLLGGEVGITYNIFLNRNQPLWKPSFSFFFSAGLGVFNGRPKADLFRGNIALDSRYYFWQDGTLRDRPENLQGTGTIVEKDGVYETDLQQWRTEGQGYSKEIKSATPYSLWNIGIPLGGGVRYVLNKQWTLSAEFDYYYFFTDYLDDVSDGYATYEELRAAFPDDGRFEIAKYISDPTGWGTNGYVGPYTSIRGNPGLKDAFTYVSFEVAYKFVWKKAGIYGQMSSR